ncbi:MAG TPA: beta-propeller fold lactonase family protein [Solirubrobacteraceae bacterium]|nr:beta-propeller fold lactonase family protein [Solirubrobacteraceae bacterium]
MPLSLAATALAVAAAVPAAASAGADHRRPPDSRIVGHVYVNDNTAPANTVAAFDRHADGSLTPVPGSPFATGGAGTGTTVPSQGALQETADGRFLLAVDPGSSQISVLRIESDGALQAVPGGVVPSGGSEPVSIALDRHLVYVANAGAGGSNYTGFGLWHGRLWPIPGSTYPLPDAAAPGDVLFNSSGTNLVGTRVGTSQIDSFAVGRDGRLTAAAGSPFAAQGAGPFGSEFRPTDPSQLFVSNAHGGAGNGTVSAFRVAGDGTLDAIGASPFADLQTAPCWVEISHDGRFLFTVNTAVPSISRYAIAPDGSLALLGSTPFAAGAGLAPFDARLSPDGRTLWVVDNGGDAVSAFAVDGGSLTELAPSAAALPAGAKPFGIVVN